MEKLSRFSRFKRRKNDGVQIFSDICTFCGFDIDDVDSESSAYWISRFNSVSRYKLVDSVLTCYQSILSMDYQKFFDKYDLDKIYF